MMADLAVILLAAGESRRMGSKNKLLLEFDGEALLRRSARMLAALPGADVTVVLGHAADQAAAVISDLDVTTTINPAFADGQRGSVFHGLSHAGPASAYLVTPADMPRLEGADCTALLHAHATAPQGSITVPMRHDSGGVTRGNPVVLTPDARDRVISGGINLGCRGLLDSQPERINMFATRSHGFFTDIDTPEAYRAEIGVLAARSGHSIPKEHPHGIN